MRAITLLLSLWLISAGCSAEPDATGDAAGASDAGGAGADVGDKEVDGGGASDTVSAPPRRWVYRSIGGVSMGAAAVNMALQHPEQYDSAGGLGGYIELRYMVTAGLRLHLGGFCDLTTLEGALAKGVDLHDPEKAPFCGPVKPTYELEYAQDFNHMHMDDNGASFDRRFYRRVFQNLTMAFGNFTTGENPKSNFLPIGVDVDDHLGRSAKDRCAKPLPVPATLSFNAEYNPKGTYAVIPFCDQDQPKDDTIMPSHYDVRVPATSPMDILLSVDLNGNGKRDYAEPVLLNARERFDDVGTDGCANAREDGAGGCLTEGAADADLSKTPDPNGDDFHWWDNPAGTEGNDWHDTDPKDPKRVEPYRDHGLDGVPGTSDEGEGDGAYSIAKAFQRARDVSAASAVALASDKQLAELDLFLDSGIRDALHAPVSTRRVVAALLARGQEVRHFQGHTGHPGALLPGLQGTQVVDQGFSADYTPLTVGKNVYVEYGDPKASQKQIDLGDGKHVGTGLQALNRLLTFMTWAISRFPKPDISATPEATVGVSEVRHYYSKGLAARRTYVVALPPGYASNPDKRYPVLYFLHGLGMSVEDLTPAGLILSTKMAEGALPKAIIVFPDGECCRVHSKTGAHHCACKDHPSKDGWLRCVEPQCTGDEESCPDVDLPKSELAEECHSGSLYFNLHADKWGNSRTDMRYADSVVELLGEVDARYRTRKPEVVGGE